MMRSMYAAISGLRSHQVMMDTTGSNIANVNTTGYKAGRVTFQDIMSQTLRQGSAPQANLGGQNPMQVGIGVQVGTIDTIVTQGSLQNTGKPTDISLQGDGYFVLSDNATSPTSSFTRDGNFDLGVAATAGADRPLVHAATGLHVKGWTTPQTTDTTTAPTTDIAIPDKVGGVAVTGFNIDANGFVNLALADGTTKNQFAQIAVAIFPNAGGLSRAGGNLYQTSANSGGATFNGAGLNGRAQTNAGFREMSNVDLAQQFTNMIVAERGFQANSRVITTSDEMLQDLVNLKR